MVRCRAGRNEEWNHGGKGQQVMSISLCQFELMRVF